jgi:hypothetical protein
MTTREVFVQGISEIHDGLGTCLYRKLKHRRSGDEVRPGWRVN